MSSTFVTTLRLRWAMFVWRRSMSRLSAAFSEMNRVTLKASATIEQLSDVLSQTPLEKGSSPATSQPSPNPHRSPTGSDPS